MKKYPYYPGCSLHSTAHEYDKSLREVCSRLAIELEEVTGWTCCGASSAHPISYLLSVALPASNLAQVASDGGSEVLVPCAACFSRFKTAAHEIENSPEVRADMEKILGAPCPDSVKITHPLELMAEMIHADAYEKKPARDLSAVKAACYYGCLLTRPPKVTQFDDCENPMSMDRILRKLGCQTLDWSYKTDCCGAGFGLTRPDIVKKLIKKILDNALAVGANVIAVACPLCHANLDSRQADLNEEGGNYHIPILYFTQLIGLAMGISPKNLALEGHLVETDPVLEMVK